jgi:hypothetical protein
VWIVLRGRPGGRRVNSSPKRAAVDLTQLAAPKGLPRSREACSFSEFGFGLGALTRAIQSSGREIGARVEPGEGCPTRTSYVSFFPASEKMLGKWINGKSMKEVGN